MTKMSTCAASVPPFARSSIFVFTRMVFPPRRTSPTEFRMTQSLQCSARPHPSGESPAWRQ